MTKKQIKLILIVVLLLIVAGGLYFQFFSQSKADHRQVINPQMIIEVTKGGLEKKISATGFVAPIEEKKLSFPTRSSGSTKIKEIYIEEGDRVERDQVLIALDKTDAQLQYIKALNVYNRAKINDSDTEIEEARLQLELTKEELENIELKAPFDGVITDISVEEGGYYSSGTAAVIIDNSRLEVEVSIEESDIPAVKLGQRVVVTLESLPGEVISGQVAEIDDEAENNNSIVTLPVKVLLDEGDYDLKLGCSADLDIITGQVTNKIIVPITAVINRNGREFVMRIEGEKHQLIPIVTGLTDGLKIVIESGLEAGDQIIVNTFQQNDTSTSGEQFRPGGLMPMPGMGGKRGGR